MQEENITAWAAQLQAGNDAAFDEIYAAYAHSAVRTAALISGDAHLAQDIAQEAFVLCALHIGSLKDTARFKPWFFRILTRCAWRMMRRRETPMDEIARRELPPALDSYPSDHHAQYAPLYRALDQLGTKQRTTVILYYFNDFSIREIAQVCAVPEATVKTRLFSARRRLEKMLRKGERSHEA